MEYPKETSISSFIESGFYAVVNDVVERILRAHTNRSDSASVANREGQDERNLTFILSLLDEIGLRYPSWIENHGSGLIKLCQRLLADHLAQVI